MIFCTGEERKRHMERKKQKRKQTILSGVVGATSVLCAERYENTDKEHQT